ncbi:hypothetical protein TNCV_4127181 [Trichonephila clavipes]|uniref:Uncharacterized protein n=1 Tax=Trichonephila clavipes TaxID=2585209 RepID=A0A8X6STR6_TRICX|nr:hypothetical protein TNCV_4127181 [Trichonephila clavipes]
MYKAVIHYRERKHLRGIDISERAGKMSKTTNPLDVRRLHAPLKTSKKVSVAVHKNRLQTIAESVGISSATCQCILTKDLNMHRVCQHIVPYMLNEDQSAEEIKSVSQAE